MSTYSSPIFETLTYGELQCSTCIASVFVGPTFVAFPIFVAAVYLYGIAYTTAALAAAYLAGAAETYVFAHSAALVATQVVAADTHGE